MVTQMDTSSRQLEIKKFLASLKVLLIPGLLTIFSLLRNLFPQAVHPSEFSLYGKRVMVWWMQYLECRMYLSSVIAIPLISRNHQSHSLYGVTFKRLLPMATAFVCI